MIRLFALILLCWLAFLSLVSWPVTLAQSPTPTDRRIYVETFAGLLNEWNARKLILTKEGLGSEFSRNVLPEMQARAKSPLFGFENQSWVAARAVEWRNLAERIESKIPLSKESTDLLMALYLNNLAEFTRVVRPDPQIIRARLQLPLLLTVATAQLEAQKVSAREITASAMTAALSNWWTGIWPLCSERSRLVPISR